MPYLLHKNIKPKGEVGCWKIEESEDWFRERLDLFDEEEKALLKIKGEGKRKEWLAARWLLHCMSGRDIREHCLKDAFGKPYLKESQWEISLSHSTHVAAVMAHPQACGIDIQKKVERITRLAHKFVNEQEKSWIREEALIEDYHLIWGAKEALYKTYSKGKVDFINDLEIRNVSHEKGTARGIIRKASSVECQILFEWVDEYLLVYTHLD